MANTFLSSRKKQTSLLLRLLTLQLISASRLQIAPPVDNTKKKRKAKKNDKQPRTTPMPSDLEASVSDTSCKATERLGELGSYAHSLNCDENKLCWSCWWDCPLRIPHHWPFQRLYSPFILTKNIFTCLQRFQRHSNPYHAYHSQHLKLAPQAEALPNSKPSSLRSTPGGLRHSWHWEPFLRESNRPLASLIDFCIFFDSIIIIISS